jgi:hypothetical protein
MRSPLLRALLLGWSAVSALACIFLGTTPARAASTALSGTAWFLLSRRKVLSLDRGELGIPERARRGPLDK